MKTAIDVFAEGFEPLPGGRLFLKAVHPDGRTRNGFRWPFAGPFTSPSADRPPTLDVCPQFVGDGLSVAKTVAGMAQGGYGPATVLVVSVPAADVVAEDEDKAKVSGGVVLDVVDGLRLLREGKGAGAYLTGAYLSGADLSGAYLGGANLTGAYLSGADLGGAIHDHTTTWPVGYTPGDKL